MSDSSEDYLLEIKAAVDDVIEHNKPSAELSMRQKTTNMHWFLIQLSKGIEEHLGKK